jgi:hypothetical protein
MSDSPAQTPGFFADLAEQIRGFNVTDLVGTVAGVGDAVKSLAVPALETGEIAAAAGGLVAAEFTAPFVVFAVGLPAAATVAYKVVVEDESVGQATLETAGDVAEGFIGGKLGGAALKALVRSKVPEKLADTIGTIAGAYLNAATYEAGLKASKDGSLSADLNSATSLANNIASEVGQDVEQIANGAENEAAQYLSPLKPEIATVAMDAENILEQIPIVVNRDGFPLG